MAPRGGNSHDRKVFDSAVQRALSAELIKLGILPPLEADKEPPKRIESEANAPRLEKSSIEAYAGITLGILLAVLHMTWWLRALLWVVLCLISADIAWRAPLVASWPQKIRLLLMLAALSLVSWCGWCNVREQIRADRQPISAISYLELWGPDREFGVVSFDPSDPDKVISGEAAGRLIVNGDLLLKYADQYRIEGVCFFWDGMQNPYDVTDLSKSDALDISEGQ